MADAWRTMDIVTLMKLDCLVGRHATYCGTTAAHTPDCIRFC